MIYDQNMVLLDREIQETNKKLARCSQEVETIKRQVNFIKDGAFLEEAPIDDKQYVRKNAEWSELRNTPSAEVPENIKDRLEELENTVSSGSSIYTIPEVVAGSVPKPDTLINLDNSEDTKIVKEYMIPIYGNVIKFDTSSTPVFNTYKINNRTVKLEGLFIADKTSIMEGKEFSNCKYWSTIYFGVDGDFTHITFLQMIPGGSSPRQEPVYTSNNEEVRWYTDKVVMDTDEELVMGLICAGLEYLTPNIQEYWNNIKFVAEPSTVGIKDLWDRTNSIKTDFSEKLNNKMDVQFTQEKLATDIYLCSTNTDSELMNCIKNAIYVEDDYIKFNTSMDITLNRYLIQEDKQCYGEIICMGNKAMFDYANNQTGRDMDNRFLSVRFGYPSAEHNNDMYEYLDKDMCKLGDTVYVVELDNDLHPINIIYDGSKPAGKRWVQSRLNLGEFRYFCGANYLVYDPNWQENGYDTPGEKDPQVITNWNDSQTNLWRNLVLQEGGKKIDFSTVLNNISTTKNSVNSLKTQVENALTSVRDNYNNLYNRVSNLENNNSGNNIYTTYVDCNTQIWESIIVDAVNNYLNNIEEDKRPTRVAVELKLPWNSEILLSTGLDLLIDNKNIISYKRIDGKLFTISPEDINIDAPYDSFAKNLQEQYNTSIKLYFKRSYQDQYILCKVDLCPRGNSSEEGVTDCIEEIIIPITNMGIILNNGTLDYGIGIRTVSYNNYGQSYDMPIIVTEW